MDIPAIAICGIATDEASWQDMPVTRIFVPRGRTIEAMAEAILAKLPDRFALCGHSMGGYVALQIMRRGGERVAGLALLSTSAAADTAEQKAARTAVIEEATDDFAGVAEKLAPAMLSPASRAVPGLLADTHAMLMRCGGELFAEQQTATALRADSTDLLQRVSVPTMVLAGEADRIVAPERSKELAAAIPGAALTIIPACGHIPQREAPGATGNALRAWIERVGEAA